MWNVLLILLPPLIQGVLYHSILEGHFVFSFAIYRDPEETLFAVLLLAAFLSLYSREIKSLFSFRWAPLLINGAALAGAVFFTSNPFLHFLFHSIAFLSSWLIFLRADHW